MRSSIRIRFVPEGYILKDKEQLILRRNVFSEIHVQVDLKRTIIKL